MSDIIIFILKAVWYILPIAVANMAPIIFRRWFNFLAVPLDFNRKYRGQPILGPHKTFRGLIAGILAGGLIFIIQKYAYLNSDFFRELSIFDYSRMTVWFGLMMGFGAIVGDLVKSLFKRRANRPPGRSWFPYDQIDFTLGGIILSLFFFVPPLEIFIFAVCFNVILHIFANAVAKGLGIRQGKW